MSDVDEMLTLLEALANGEHDDFSVVDEAVHEIKALCGVNDWLRAENERLRKAVAGDDSDLARLLDKYAEDCQEFFDQVENFSAENERLRAENEALRADAERYRHIRSNIDAVQALVGPDAVPRLVGGGLKELGRYCDECIDDVMRSSGRVSDE